MCHVGVQLVRLYEKMHKKDIILARDVHLYMNDDYQPMATSAGIDKLSQPTVQNVIDKVKHLLSDKVTNVDNFSKNISILIPDDPQLAVLRGAVNFVQNPNII